MMDHFAIIYCDGRCSQAYTDRAKALAVIAVLRAHGGHPMGLLRFRPKHNRQVSYPGEGFKLRYSRNPLNRTSL